MDAVRIEDVVRWSHGCGIVQRRDGDVDLISPVEAEGYLLNLTSPEPKVFVLWRDEEGIPRPERLSVSYNEGTRWADSDENVDSVSLPKDLAAWIGEYAAAHYRPEPKRKPRYASSKDKGVASRRDG